MLAIYIETTVSERLNPISFNDERFRRQEQNIRYNARINPTGTPSLYVRVSVCMYVYYVGVSVDAICSVRPS